MDDKIARVVAEKAGIIDRVKLIGKRAMEAAACGTTLTAETGSATGAGDGSDATRAAQWLQVTNEKRMTYKSTVFPGTLTAANARNAAGQEAAVLYGWLTRPSKGAACTARDVAWIRFRLCHANECVVSG